MSITILFVLLGAVVLYSCSTAVLGYPTAARQDMFEHLQRLPLYSANSMHFSGAKSRRSPEQEVLLKQLMMSLKPRFRRAFAGDQHEENSRCGEWSQYLFSLSIKLEV
jgi:hypothetical protein